MEIKVSKVVDCVGENCPMPLVKTREVIMKGKKGDMIKVIGTHPQSFEEIPMALEVLDIKILEKSKEDNGKWYIIFKI
ncbi:sulfurtransferase TusA family protein [Patescibacteria group bacterium]|nr:sulfurtransferase TusA family protein [Patescibacteria group bacterium]